MDNMEQENRPADEAAASRDAEAGADASVPPEAGNEGAGGAESEGTAGAGTAPAKGPYVTLDRAIARFIDILIALLFARLPGYIGFFAALTYIGIADGFMGGRSIGKRLIGLRVLCPDMGRAANFRDSILRNSTVGLAFILAQIPLVGWALGAAGLAFEFVLMVGSAEGKRLGDEIASTVVIKDAAPDRTVSAGG